MPLTHELPSSGLRSLAAQRWGLALLAGALALGCASTASTVSGMRGAGPYLRTGVGPAVFDSSTGDDPTFSGSVDEEDTAILVGGGYRFGETFAAEFAWVDLGEVAYKGRYSGTPARGTVEASGIELSAIGSYPIYRTFDVTGRVGAFVWDAEDSGRFGGGSFRDDKDGVDPILGIGAQANLFEQVALRIEWVRFFDVWDTDPNAFLFQVLVRI